MNKIYSIMFPTKKLWKNIKSISNLNTNKHLDKQDLKIKSKTKGILIDKTFILSEKYLFYLKNDKLKGYVNLDFIGLEYSNKSKKITFFNDFNYFSLYFNDAIIFKKWKNYLKRFCIFNNFYNKYNVIEKIGEGANSQVLLCKKLSSNKKYAAKVISKKGLDSENYKALINEITIMKSINHTNFIKYKELYETENNFFLIQEYCNYSNLNNFLKTNKKNNYLKNSFIKQILSGINYMNSLNLVHRDLKPDNIFLHKTNDDFIIKIGDFGLSNFLNQPFIFKRCGTPGYISPEIINYNKELNYNITNKVDIYSFGHIIYNILSDQCIFDYYDLEDLIYQNKKNNYIICNSLSKSSQKLIKLCLIKDPSSRIDIKKLTKLINKEIN